jgi:hypothetical protein
MSTPTRRFHLPSAVRRSSYRIDAQQARELLGEGALLVDVRRQDDPGDGTSDAIRIAPDEVPGRLPEFPRDLPVVLACT